MRRSKRLKQNEDQESDIPLGQLRDMMLCYNIHFLQYSSDWPEQYKDILHSIKQTEQIKLSFDKEIRWDSGPDNSTTDQTREQVIDVVNVSNRHYRNGSSEQTLRMSLEPLVFRRLESEIDW